MKNAWRQCLEILQKEINYPQYAAWIKPLSLNEEQSELNQANPKLSLHAPNQYTLDWVTQRYLKKIQIIFEEILEKKVDININIKPKNNPIKKINAPAAYLRSNSVVEKSIQPGQLITFNQNRLNVKLTFDTLVEGRSNQLARAAAMQVSNDPGKAYNPLFIYGGTGLGKTHLIHSIGNHVQKLKKDSRIRYIQANDYFNEYVNSIKKKSFSDFKKSYENLDVLLVDDIQFFSGKERTQEEFFYIFNHLVSRGKQIIITSDTYPNNLQGVRDRLTSRFSSGLTVQVEQPDLEMRLAILKNKIEKNNFLLSEDILFYIAKSVRSNVRELEGSLNKLLAFSRFSGKKSISLDIAKETLKDLLGSQSRQITLDQIHKMISEYFKISPSDLFSKKRSKAIVRPRQTAMWLAREMTNHSLPEIGQYYGGRDHTTVLHACRLINQLKEQDDQFKHQLNIIIQLLKN